MSTEASVEPQSGEAPSDREFLGRLRSTWSGAERPRYWLTRFLYLRAIGFIYCVAFAVLWNQGPGLLGSHGILPAARYLDRIRESVGPIELPTLFWLGASDNALRGGSLLGLGLSLAVLCGAENALLMAALWMLYMSFCHVGQTFYGYGWEILLLEAAFLAIFLAPLASIRPLASKVAPSPVAIWLVRWLVFRVMFGAGLIKIRGDFCWTELTCLAFHYETQPVPNPLSWVLHQAPLWFHQLGALFNHLVELFACWLVLGPRPWRYVGGALIVLFQAILIASGNLSFLNWLTIAIAIPCFDDAWLGRCVPRRLRERAQRLEQARRQSTGQRATVGVLAVVVAVLSLAPIANMLSPHQAMNTSFEPLHLVNSYGAFGWVDKQRREVIVEGTRDRVPGPSTRWTAYEFKCKPGDLLRAPCLISPYHYRLDWQMWFLPLADVARETWFLRFVYKLLRGEPVVRGLLARDPFGNSPPAYIRAQLYFYRFTSFGDHRRGFWWRQFADPYLQPVSLREPWLREQLARRGGLDPGDSPR